MNAFDLNLRPALASHVRAKSDPVTGDPVLLFPEGLLVLNATANDIVGLCDGRATGHEILASLSSQYEVDESILRADFVECLADLLLRNLVVLHP
jgi:pyrroloquinoline quinone biosynthesis protein D